MRPSTPRAQKAGGDGAVETDPGIGHGEDGAPVPDIIDRVTFKLHRVNAKVAQMCNPVFAEHDIDIISSRILALLAERGRLGVGDLVELMVLPQSTISHQLKRLDKRGLITRRRRDTDNRAVDVTLTEEGQRVAEDCQRLSELIYRRVTAGLDQSELANVQGVLDRLWDNLDRF
ncbi:MAG: MarR family transcriptional regulator [Pseudomonadota bacterium]